ncbi:hypothetical protein B0O99DRAFT_634740 [Bisporella sp. PMI_857]|nr:hypothetical protein B0O99DRAFT_634740 [Bisporella sp. PMI_857]
MVTVITAHGIYLFIIKAVAAERVAEYSGLLLEDHTDEFCLRSHGRGVCLCVNLYCHIFWLFRVGEGKCKCLLTQKKIPGLDRFFCE